MFYDVVMNEGQFLASHIVFAQCKDFLQMEMVFRRTSSFFARNASRFSQSIKVFRLVSLKVFH